MKNISFLLFTLLLLSSCSGLKITQQEANGDISVNMFIIMDEQTGITNYNSYYTMGGWGYYSSFGYGYGYGGGNYMYTIKKGTLIIDVFDHRGKNFSGRV